MLEFDAAARGHRADGNAVVAQGGGGVAPAGGVAGGDKVRDPCGWRLRVCHVRKPAAGVAELGGSGGWWMRADM